MSLPSSAANLVTQSGRDRRVQAQRRRCRGSPSRARPDTRDTREDSHRRRSPACESLRGARKQVGLRCQFPKQSRFPFAAAVTAFAS